MWRSTWRPLIPSPPARVAMSRPMPPRRSPERKNASWSARAVRAGYSNCGSEETDVRRYLFAGGLLAAGVLVSAPLLGAERSSFLPVERDTLLLDPGKSVACLKRPNVFARTLELTDRESRP